MAITVTFMEEEAVFLCGAIAGTVERSRDFCRETDAKFGRLNNLHKEAISLYRDAHARLLRELREKGYPMNNADIADDPIDTKL